MKKPKQKKRIVHHIYDEDDWFKEMLRLKDAAEEEGNMAACARFSELIAKRKGFVMLELPERQKELDDAQQQEARRIALIRYNPQVIELVDRLIANGEIPLRNQEKTYPDVYNKAENATKGDPIAPPAVGERLVPSTEKTSGQFGVPEKFLGNSGAKTI